MWRGPGVGDFGAWLCGPGKRFRADSFGAAARGAFGQGSWCCRVAAAEMRGLAWSDKTPLQERCHDHCDGF